MKLYAISGLGADQRVFQFLKLNHEIVTIDWIRPLTNESIENYSKRLSKVINTEESFGLIGVSFGGLIATEITKILSSKITILISSAETYKDLRPIYNVIGQLGIAKFFPKQFFNLPKSIANWLFGAQNNKLLSEILDDTDLNFTKWAVVELTKWKNITTIQNVVKIHGSKDKLIPLNNQCNSHVVDGGEHFMIVDRASEISEIINRDLT
jgi:pimeloyl-ACP methyl ester carboxylesterase